MVFLSDVLKCREAMIDLLMMLGDFSVFSLNVTDGHTDGRMDEHTDGHKDGQTFI